MSTEIYAASVLSDIADLLHRCSPIRERTSMDYFGCVCISATKEQRMSFALYMIGLLLLLAGIGWALIAAGIAQLYVAIALLIVAGVGVMTAVSRTRTKDPPA